MTNSPIEIADALTFVEKLMSRTKEGKLAWQASNHRDYTTTLGANLRAEVSEGEFLDFSLTEFDPHVQTAIDLIGGTGSAIEDKELLNVSIEKQPAYGYDTMEEKALAEMLRDLIVLARRSALDVNSSMKRALTYLDKIAG